ncbi:MAG: rhodanese-like domain-containing protein [Ignavibacteriota bacterium]|nr:rhodanese-like domain-containing protein [Ignavibacteriota bacterium]
MFNIFGSSVESINAEKFDELIKEGYTIIDVRTQQEFNDARIQGAQLIDIYKSDFISIINELDKEGKYLVYCASGSRSTSAVSKMNKAGIKTALNLSGGIMSWHRAGKPLVR